MAKLLRPAVRCPKCGRQPALRVYEDLAEAVAELPPERPMATYQCQSCREVYTITARAYHEAA